MQHGGVLVIKFKSVLCGCAELRLFTGKLISVFISPMWLSGKGFKLMGVVWWLFGERHSG